MSENPLIFISYASPDRERVVVFHDYLKAQGFHVWMDFQQLKGGQNWHYEITRALNRATLILMFVSENSVDRRGYLQREIKISLDRAHERLVDDIYIVPVLLDETAAIPEQLDDIQFINAGHPNVFDQIKDSITHQLERIGAETSVIQNESHISWFSSRHSDSWDGLPGYRSEFNLLHFSSSKFSHISEITDVIKGDMLKNFQDQRRDKLSQSDLFNFGQDEFFRTDTWDANAETPIIQGRVLSLKYLIGWYGAGAAHPNYHIKTYAYSLNPMIPIKSLSEIFTSPDEAFPIVSEHVRRELLAKDLDGGLNEPLKLDEQDVQSGTASWEDFSAFVFLGDGIELSFSPYHVGPYAYGVQTTLVPYDLIVESMDKFYRCALDIEHLICRKSFPTPLWEATDGEDAMNDPSA